MPVSSDTGITQSVAAYDAGANALMPLKGSLGTSLELDSLPYFVRCSPEGRGV